MTPLCTLRRALSDPKLLGSVLSGDSWAVWRTLLIAAMGEALTPDERVIFKRLTGREREPLQRVSELTAVVGRRGGKSRALSVLACYIAALCEHRLAPGERGLVLIVAQNQRAARIILDYAEACLDAAPLLRPLVIARSDSAIELKGGVALEVRWQSFRAVRGFTLLAAIGDELAYWWNDDTYANPDIETLAAIRPGLLTSQGPLILASSPYARRGVLWQNFNRHYGPDGAPDLLVAHGATRSFNPTVPQAWIDHELERDPARNNAEYNAIFRTDVEGFITLEVVETCLGDYLELLPNTSTRYRAFVDPAGGSGADSFTLAIAHRDRDGTAVIDVARERRPPFSPANVIREFAALLKSYRVAKVSGDRFAGGFAAEAFRQHGIGYSPSAKPKSDLYLDLLPLLNSGGVVLPRHDRLVQQLVALERRTSRAGKDSIDHGPGAHDDVANAVAGAALLARKPGYDSSLAWISGPDRAVSAAGVAAADDGTSVSAVANFDNSWQRAQRNAYVMTGGYSRR